MKQCKKCLKHKELTNFSPRKNRKTNTHSFCKECKAKIEQQRRKPILNVLSKNAKNYRSKNKNTFQYKASVLLNGMKRRTTVKGYTPVEFTLQEITKIITDGTCEVIGRKFNIEPTLFSRNPFAPSPDRIDNNVGYTKQNTRWVCAWFNVMCGEYPDTVVQKFINDLQDITLIDG